MWKRLKKARSLGGTRGIRRAYGSDGKLWPRIVLSIIPDRYEDYPAVKISCSRKKNSHEWWEDVGTPKELLGELVDIIQEGNDSVDIPRCAECGKPATNTERTFCSEHEHMVF